MTLAQEFLQKRNNKVSTDTNESNGTTMASRALQSGTWNQPQTGDDFKNISQLVGADDGGTEVGLGDVMRDTFDFSYGEDDTNMANEKLGAGIKEASGYNSGNMMSEMGKGVSDLINGGFIGMDATVADLINFFDGDNSVADHYRGLAQERTNNANYPEGAATAVGQEAGAMAVEAPLIGKAIDVGLGGAKIAKNALYNAPVTRRAKAWNVANEKTVKENSMFAEKEINKNPFVDKESLMGKPKAGAIPETPTVTGITDLISKLSPSLAKIIRGYWTDLIAPISKNAAMKKIATTKQTLIDNGVSPLRAEKMVGDIYQESLKAKQIMGKAITKPAFGFEGTADNIIDSIGRGSENIGSALGKKVPNPRPGFDAAMQRISDHIGAKTSPDMSFGNVPSGGPGSWRADLGAKRAPYKKRVKKEEPIKTVDKLMGKATTKSEPIKTVDKLFTKPVKKHTNAGRKAIGR